MTKKESSLTYLMKNTAGRIIIKINRHNVMTEKESSLTYLMKNTAGRIIIKINRRNVMTEKESSLTYLMKNTAGRIIHLVKLVNTTYAIISQHQCTTVKQIHMLAIRAKSLVHTHCHDNSRL